MKKFLAALIVTMLAIPTPAHAFLGGGGIKGPIAVYSKNSSVDAATIANQINTLQQLQAALKNLKPMDGSTSKTNRDAIKTNIEQLIEIQKQVKNTTSDYAKFQQEWDATYGQQSGISGADNAAQAQRVIQATDQATYDAMRMQGFAMSTAPGTAANLNHLLDASNSAEGALAAAQVANQIAALQTQQLMLLQQQIAANNQAQLAYQKQRESQNRAAEEAAEQAFSGKFEPQRGQGPGFGW